ncbi:hypothetical protein MgSA37_01843 [Mucilaginibacter gotjawali]|uniref:Glycosyl hydrolase family 95 N-terminal domain-containing protein n=1 Tax=Mucilaginibacter gotjawali TaxID=1550579 RepID=A0A0X8X0Q1_9SPHI|nr:glycoside hydrolase N-terminal domain-containing protein [Mucilaginibacter gotjawali]BAU53674.1 hypothetical protein MgSA37_01843 [Mucilaginibacter gotjawali]
MKKVILGFVLFLWFNAGYGQSSVHDLQFDTLAKRWDEAIPLGNGMLGALVWQKDDKLRFSLDRADLWDLRPMKDLHRKEFSYQWVIGQVNKKTIPQYSNTLTHPMIKSLRHHASPAGRLSLTLAAGVRCNRSICLLTRPFARLNGRMGQL